VAAIAWQEADERIRIRLKQNVFSRRGPTQRWRWPPDFGQVGVKGRRRRNWTGEVSTRALNAWNASPFKEGRNMTTHRATG